MKIQKLLLLGIFVFVFFPLKAQKQNYEITFSRCLNHQIPKDFFKGKYVVLDFWQTWCGPCIASFKDANELMAKYDTTDIVFANINNEVRRLDLVKDILKRKPFNGYQLIDDNNQTYNRFKVKMFPSVYILSPEGKILWRGHPVSLNEMVIFDKTGIQPVVFENETQAKTGLYILKIYSSYKKEKPQLFFSANKRLIVINYRSLPLKDIIAELYQTSAARIVANDKRFNTQKVSVYGKFSAGKFSQAQVRAFVLKKLQKHYRFKTDTVLKETKVWLLSVADKKLLKHNRVKNSSNEKVIMEELSINYKNYLLKDAFFDLEKRTGVIFTADSLPDKIASKRYNLQIPSDFENLQKVLLNKYGLLLTEKEMTIKKILLR